MTGTPSFPAGSPCWVETLQPDPESAASFYGELFGWTFDEAGPDGSRVARLDGRSVAGVAQAPPILDRGAWVMYVLVGDLDATVDAVQEAGGTVLAGPLEIREGERSALFTDPAGAAFGAREGSAPTVSEAVDVPDAWQMSALHTPDVEAAGAFYATVFGWRMEPVPGSALALWRLDGSTRKASDPTLPDDVVAVATQTPGASGVPTHWAINVQAADVDDIARRVVELGGSVLMPPTDAPGFRNALIADPQGGVLALSQIIR
ncbi:VOC family protein [Arthrobacter sp.]|uniref:VOC family protein n=1 Tax=Arthrobacter sp. TaxID=1667 RepID=UPI00258D9D34|nr:VOC family protein [Arthrobacter sp.]